MLHEWYNYAEAVHLLMGSRKFSEVSYEKSAMKNDSQFSVCNGLG